MLMNAFCSRHNQLSGPLWGWVLLELVALQFSNVLTISSPKAAYGWDNSSANAEYYNDAYFNLYFSGSQCYVSQFNDYS